MFSDHTMSSQLFSNLGFAVTSLRRTPRGRNCISDFAQHPGLYGGCGPQQSNVLGNEKKKNKATHLFTQATSFHIVLIMCLKCFLCLKRNYPS